MPVDKLTVAHQHVVTAIKLIALGSPPHSVHVLAMAADAIIRSVAEHRKYTLTLDVEAFIRTERMKEYRTAKNRAYNFMKHADRDADEVLDRTEDKISEMNDIFLLQSCAHLIELGFKDPALNIFASSMALLNPTLIDRNSMEKSAPALLYAYDSFAETFTRGNMRELLLATFVQSGAINVDELDFATTAAKHLR